MRRIQPGRGIILLALCGWTAVSAQSRRLPPSPTVYDSLTKLIVYVDEKRNIRDTLLYEKDTGTYVPHYPVAALRPDAAVEVVQHYDIPYTAPRLHIAIRLSSPVVRDIRDLRFYATISNKTPRAQKFLFDRPRQPGFALWGASCRITSSPPVRILKHEGNPAYETRAASAEIHNRHMYTLAPHEWMIKQFSVADIAVWDEKYKRLPPGTYNLQFIFQENYSNIIQFTVR